MVYLFGNISEKYMSTWFFKTRSQKKSLLPNATAGSSRDPTMARNVHSVSGKSGENAIASRSMHQKLDGGGGGGV